MPHHEQVVDYDLWSWQCSNSNHKYQTELIEWINDYFRTDVIVKSNQSSQEQQRGRSGVHGVYVSSWDAGFYG